MTQKFGKGSHVRWNWANGTGEGRMARVFTEKVTLQIEGAGITRNATEDNPAYLIEQDDGGRELKSHSELNARDGS